MYSGSASGLPGLLGAIVFMKSELLLGDDPMPLRRMLKPAPVVRLKSRSSSSFCLVLSDIFVIKFALWKAKLNPKPSIRWYVWERSTVIVFAWRASIDLSLGAAAAPLMATATVRKVPVKYIVR